MQFSSGLPAQEQLRPRRSDAGAPAWARDMARTAALRSSREDGFDICAAAGPAATLLRLELPDAASLDAADLEQCTLHAYRLLRRRLARTLHPHPVRFWNFLPDINQAMDERRDRYMVFNAGRYAAFGDWFFKDQKFSSALPAASAVGHPGRSLVICCLSMHQPGSAVENPRQIPAFGYSPRYGPRPPCFSRATVVKTTTSAGARRELLLASGTASIVGERTTHPANLPAQLEESLCNLRSLLSAANSGAGSSAAADSLHSFHSVRIYYPQPQHGGAVASAAQVAFGTQAEVELIQAPLCRPDLLVEIEGIARLDARSEREKQA